jgi:hypothetical protein
LAYAIFSTMSKALEDGSLAVPRNSLTDNLPVSVGRPVALANCGWSLELATAPYENESTILSAPPDKPLLDYEFPLKLGDGLNRRDGVIGYFMGQSSTTQDPAPFDYGKMFTYFQEEDMPDGVADPREIIDSSNLPSFKPFYEAPTAYDTPHQYHRQRGAHASVFAMMLDPFAPIHVYSGILPITSLSLPPWTVERAMKSLTASIRVGPTLLPIDLPAFSAGREPKSLSDVEKAAHQDASHGLPIPAMANSGWAWMQPYPNDEAARGTAATGNTTTAATEGVGDGTQHNRDSEVRYNAFPICQQDVKPRLDRKSMLCVVEGYLELTAPLVVGAPTTPAA